MARSTPTYTPVRNYAIGIFLSAFLLFSDISYGTFSPLRGLMHASSLYAQMISSNIFSNINNTFSSFQKNAYLLEKNKELTEQILKIKTQDFIQRKDNEEKIQISNFHNDLISVLGSKNINLFKISSIDLRNYLC